ncbi:phosphoribosyltransferase family protein [Halobacteriovorax sp. ZH4_bin.1]|uniref:phosphoribosyltransferase n=1 Tax=unclassified Halobacteriovorax TaxID=2639665 RepID=UPI003716EC86
MFKSRKEAGKLLAEEFKDKILADSNTLVIALPRGGVPVAYEIAKRYELPLDVFCVKKIGAPRNQELAIGAVTESGDIYYNKELVSHFGLNDLQLRRLTNDKKQEAIEQAKLLRKNHSPMDLSGRDILIVDDGIATGATVKAAIKLIKQHKPNQIQVVTPVCSREAWSDITNTVDDMLVLETPHNFLSVGEFYLEFPQVSNMQVREMLEEIYLLTQERKKQEQIERYENEGGPIKKARN